MSHSEVHIETIRLPFLFCKFCQIFKKLKGLLESDEKITVINRSPKQVSYQRSDIIPSSNQQIASYQQIAS